MATLNSAVARIDAEARQLDPAKVLLTILIAPLFLTGWLAGKAWLVLAWIWTAVLVGWREARAPRPLKAADDEQ
ncbi:hypothetical protein OG320_05135 [Microbispora sp. NBC_01189]|uniref:hypothetical protein n=1 Tax=Microbispora sp. NBC_01189 TaxID=2903583 RepID=UPI002E14D51F|nr:hypothetical protein OG320_05135 [Microbispora sp. NBC_01189]